MTDAGILLLYKGADDHLVYGPGWVLFDKADPRRALGRSFIAPVLDWQKAGQVPNVIFLYAAVAQSLGAQLDWLLRCRRQIHQYIGALQLNIVLP